MDLSENQYHTIYHSKSTKMLLSKPDFQKIFSVPHHSDTVPIFVQCGYIFVQIKISQVAFLLTSEIFNLIHHLQPWGEVMQLHLVLHQSLQSAFSVHLQGVREGGLEALVEDPLEVDREGGLE